MPERPEEKPTKTPGQHANRKALPVHELSPGPSCWEVILLTDMPPWWRGFSCYFGCKFCDINVGFYLNKKDLWMDLLSAVAFWFVNFRLRADCCLRTGLCRPVPAQWGFSTSCSILAQTFSLDTQEGEAVGVFRGVRDVLQSTMQSSPWWAVSCFARVNATHLLKNLRP